MKNLWAKNRKSMQNDRPDLTVILAEKNCQKMHCIPRYLQNKWRKMNKEVQISLDKMHFLAIFFNKNDREIEPVVLHTINPMNSTKWVTSFSWIFHFLLIDFSKKIFEFFFRKCLMPWGYVELCTMSNKKKTYFGGRYGFLCRMLGLEWDYWDCFLVIQWHDKYGRYFYNYIRQHNFILSQPSYFTNTHSQFSFN